MATGPDPYRIDFKPSAAAALAALSRKDQVRIGRRIDALATDPRPRRSEQLKGRDDLYRIRSGNYRVLYQIEDDRLTVLIVRIAHRRESYRNLGDA
jgi:mRNA interferase RelE/StbE